jgi:hypothetical protein
MSKFKEGDTVSVVARDANASDIKSGLYYGHYANLSGTILKVYGEEASVLIDPETLPTDIRKRHEANQAAMRQKWLDGLSEEGRGKLTASEKAFRLNYAVLVSTSDLNAHKSVAKATAKDLDSAEEAFLAARKN